MIAKKKVSVDLYLDPILALNVIASEYDRSNKQSHRDCLAGSVLPTRVNRSLACLASSFSRIVRPGMILFP